MDRWMDDPEAAEMLSEDRSLIVWMFAVVVVVLVVGSLVMGTARPAGDAGEWWEGGEVGCDFFEDGSLACQNGVSGCLVGELCDERSR